FSNFSINEATLLIRGLTVFFLWPIFFGVFSLSLAAPVSAVAASVESVAVKRLPFFTMEPLRTGVTFPTTFVGRRFPSCLFSPMSALSFSATAGFGDNVLLLVRGNEIGIVFLLTCSGRTGEKEKSESLSKSLSLSSPSRKMPWRGGVEAVELPSCMLLNLF